MWVVFDVDGTLIDVSESYDMAVKLTVEHILKTLGRDERVNLDWVRGLRSKGAFGDDFRVSEALTLIVLGGDAEKLVDEFPEGGGLEWVRERLGLALDTVLIERVFNTFYLGDAYEDALFPFPGLWRKEKPMISPKLLEELSERFNVGVVTGRNELEMRLAEKITGFKFKHAVTREHGLKPDPSLLWKLVRGEKGVYIGDTKNDEMFVENYRKKYGEFGFLMIGRDVKNVEEGVRAILNGEYPWRIR
ncbi:MAG: hydrolase [Thermococcus sp.]|nr:hydrolase [Thermococcus sp.]